MRSIFFLWLLLGSTVLRAESWTEALARMPLPTGTTHLSRTNCAEILLSAFHSNTVVKTLIFMPGATDELYFFRRAQASLISPNSTLLDAVVALTNQTHIRATLHPPFLLLHSDEDVLDVPVTIEHAGAMEKLRQGKPLPPLMFLDKDWDAVRKKVKGHIKPILWPGPYSNDSRHFYRHTFAAWNLSPWETLEAIAFAAKARITVRRSSVVFTPDERFGTLPKLEKFP